MSDPRPSFSKTYRAVDGELPGDYGWVTDLEHFAYDEEPIELVEETWERTGVRTFWHLPDTLYSCAADLECDEDAIDWRMLDDVPVPACKYHASDLPPLAGEEPDEH